MTKVIGTLRIPECSIQLDDVTIRSESQAQHAPAIIEFTLKYQAADYGSFRITHTGDLDINDGHEPAIPTDIPYPSREALEGLLDAVKLIYEAERRGVFGICDYDARLFTAEEIIKPEHQDHLEDFPGFDFSTSPFWLLDYKEGLHPITWDDIEQLADLI